MPSQILPRIACFALLALMSLASVAEAGSTIIGGKRMSCSVAQVTWTSKYPYNGYTTPGRIYLNPQILGTYPAVTRQFIFLHECGHQFVGYDNRERAADCWAIRRGRQQGWLNQPALDRICRSMQYWPGNDVHLPGPARCAALRSCFAAASGRRRAGR